MTPTPVNAPTSADRLSACPGCGCDVIVTLQPAHDHPIFLTSADEMVVTTGVCGCERCGLTFLNPRMGSEKLFDYYAKQSRIPRDVIAPDSPFAALMNIQIDAIAERKTLKAGMRVLEVGCAEGFFLRSLNQRVGGGLLLYGVELSENYLKQARKILPGAKLFETPLEKTDFAGTRFDVIVLRHVLEHLGDPIECLRSMRSALAPTGIVYIEVPDSSVMSPSVSRFYHHEHLLYFTPEVLHSYLDATGLLPVVCERFVRNPPGSGFSYPVIRAIAGAGEQKSFISLPGRASATYLENNRSEQQYLESLLDPIRALLRSWKVAGKTIGLFGAGPHTMDLLGLLESEEVEWATIFDNNPAKHGKTMRGIPIAQPTAEALSSLDCILVSSAEFEDEMLAQCAAVGNRVEAVGIYGNHADR